MDYKDNLIVVQETIRKIDEKVGVGLDSDKNSKIAKTIEYNGREHKINLTREEFLEDCLIDISKLLESINYGFL